MSPAAQFDDFTGDLILTREALLEAQGLALAIDVAAGGRHAKADKWFRRNCKDVLSRECTAAEKADVLAWLVQLK